MSAALSVQSQRDLIVAPVTSSPWCQVDLLPGDSFAAPKGRLDISQVRLTPLRMNARDDRH